ncbi:MAG: tetratricopeptide repeat protein [Candidatus Thiodiazotropha sp. 6PLUC2]
MKKLFLLILFALGALNAAAEMSPEVLAISESWAEIKYQMPADQRVEALEMLSEKAETLVKDNPGAAEPIVWQAIIVSTLAGEKGGLGALSLVKEAKKLLERAEAFDPDVLDGSVYTSLGSLYYQVPGWPIGFGSDEKAKSYLKKALAVNPNGIDPNYFYGDFLLQEGEYNEAAEVLKRALAAPARESRPIADAGRRAEIEEALKKVKLAMQ